MHQVRRHPEVPVADVCASFQAAVVDVLVTKARRAADQVGAASVALAGGVAANSELRRRWVAAAAADGLEAHVPARALCTDNAAMVAAAGAWRLGHDGPTPLDAGADPNLALVYDGPRLTVALPSVASYSLSPPFSGSGGGPGSRRPRSPASGPPDPAGPPGRR